MQTPASITPATLLTTSNTLIDGENKIKKMNSSEKEFIYSSAAEIMYEIKYTPLLLENCQNF